MDLNQSEHRAEMADKVNSVYNKVERNRSLATDQDKPDSDDQDDDSNAQYFI